MFISGSDREGLLMYHMINSLGRRALIDELPAGLVALIAAEAFYKFHSFTLECGAFLATWYVLGNLHARVRRG
jgi:hypothetical protein